MQPSWPMRVARRNAGKTRSMPQGNISTLWPATETNGATSGCARSSTTFSTMSTSRRYPRSRRLKDVRASSTGSLRSYADKFWLARRLNGATLMSLLNLGDLLKQGNAFDSQLKNHSELQNCLGAI